MIIAGGKEIKTPSLEVKLWHETGLGFPALAKRSETRAVVLHWTGGEGGGPDVHRTLGARRLSVHFLIDQKGVVWQYCDADMLCAHAKGANPWSVGIEIANRATVFRPGQNLNEKWPRKDYTEHVHGKPAACKRFYWVQVQSAIKLTKALCEHYGLPYRAPTRNTYETEKYLAQWRGVLGHFHINEKKRDPGIWLLNRMGLRDWRYEKAEGSSES